MALGLDKLMSRNPENLKGKVKKTSASSLVESDQTPNPHARPWREGALLQQDKEEGSLHDLTNDNAPLSSQERANLAVAKARQIVARNGALIETIHKRRQLENAFELEIQASSQLSFETFPEEKDFDPIINMRKKSIWEKFVDFIH